ncbi:hypothetical protein [Dinoroseobacter sp. S124A]|uniref:hypothetical protein n=1 Tax=Dinoroseobacter sp. S124A TaxID=3415128 RepID=UPI003C7B3F6F
MRIVALAALGLSLAGCAIPQDQRGQVYEFTGETVTIRGAFVSTSKQRFAAPTEAMVAQAKEVCPNATYLGANPSPTDGYTSLFLFRC